MTTPLRVLFVVNSLNGGGAELNVRLLLRHLDRARFAPEVVSLLPVPEGSGVPSIDGNGPSRLMRRWSRMREFLEARRPDVMFAFLEYSHLLSLATAGEVPVVVSVRTEPRRSLEMLRSRLGAFRGAAFAIMLRTLYPRAAALHVQTPGAAESLRELCPRVGSARVRVIPNPVDIEEIRRRSAKGSVGDPPDVLYVGRLSWEKNLLFLLRSFARTRAKSLVIVGTGDDEDALRAEAARLGIASRVRFTGYQANPYPWIRAARVVVLSSRFEGFPVVLTEAMACGVPVVSTDCPTGPREIVVPGETGLLVPPDDAEALASALDRLLGDPELARRMGERGFERVQQWDVRRILPRYEDLLLSSRR